MISGAFFIFTALLLAVYVCVPARAQRYVLSVGSLVFCAVFCPLGAAVMLVQTAAAYLVCRFVADKNRRGRKAAFIAAVLFFVLCAVCVKYLVPRTEGLSLLQTFDLSKTAVLLGASYFLLRLISCTADVYAGRCEPFFGFFDLLLYICWFPALVQGPVERAGGFLRRIPSDKKLMPTYGGVRKAGQRILVGLFKALVVGGYAGRYAACVSQPAGHAPLFLIYCLCMYSVYIYANFSGGIDIARGVSCLFGIELSDNFRFPYFSQSFREFWQRWHITFSGWLKDYVYIPLGGGRCGAARSACNVVVVFAVSALWHGVAPGFIVWGLLHAVYQLAGRAFRKKAADGRQPLVPYLLRSARTFLLSTFAWLFFCVPSYDGAAAFLASLFTYGGRGAGLSEIYGFESFGGVGMIYLALTAVYFLFEMLADRYSFDLFSKEKTPALLRWTAYAAMLFIVLAFGFYGGGYDGASFVYGGF